MPDDSKHRTLHILNLGAGVQSTALYLMSLRQDEPEHVPVFDYAVFADTQDEPKAVYEHLEWLKGLGGPPILVRTAGRLSDSLINGVASPEGRFASIPSFTAEQEGSPLGITRRQCTREFKIDVIERTIKREILGMKPRQRISDFVVQGILTGDMKQAGRDAAKSLIEDAKGDPKVQIIQYLGLSFDEPGRIARTQGRFQGHAWASARFPLFDLQMTRAGCVLYLETAAPERTVPRSACIFCPYHNNAEWRLIRDKHPEEWVRRAIAIDDAIRDQDSRCAKGLNQKLYLHRSCKPLREAPIDTPESRGEQYVFGFANECQGMCGV